LDLFSASLQKQLPAGRHVAPSEHIIQIRANQFFLLCHMLRI